MGEKRVETKVRDETFIIPDPHLLENTESRRIIGLRIVLFILLFCIIFVGLITVFFFIPWSCGFRLFDVLFIPLRILISLVISLVIIWSCYDLYFSQKSTIGLLEGNVKRTLLFFLYIDKDLKKSVLSHDDNSCNGYSGECEKDLALGILLQKLYGQRFPSRVAKNQLKNALSSLREYRILYQKLLRLDSLFERKLPSSLIQKYPEIVFSIKRDLLESVLKTYLHGQFLVFTYDDEQECYLSNDIEGTYLRPSKYSTEDKPLVDFFNMVLNFFYSNFRGYKLQPHDYKPELLIEYFDQFEKEYHVVLHGFEEDILYYEKAIRELEEEITDLHVQIHDLQTILRVFLAEYNAKVGVLYVQLDRLKMKIEEYRLRIERMKGKTLSDEDIQDIEEEVEKTFSEERKRLEDLYNQTSESTEEYVKYKEREEEWELFDEDFLRELKRLFRKLVMAFHPDHAKDEKEREEFHRIFIKIKEAYEEGNIEILKKYLKKIKVEKEEERESPFDKLKRLEEEYRRLSGFCEGLKTELESLERSELNILRRRVEDARLEERDLLQELADGMRMEIMTKQEELEELMEEYRRLLAQNRE